MDTFLGPVGVRMAGDLLVAVSFPPPGTAVRAPDNAAAADVVGKLLDYFRDPASDLQMPLDSAGTPFQQRVWQALCRIPAGQVRTYGDLAREPAS